MWIGSASTLQVPLMFFLLLLSHTWQYDVRAACDGFMGSSPWPGVRSRSIRPSPMGLPIHPGSFGGGCNGQGLLGRAKCTPPLSPGQVRPWQQVPRPILVQAGACRSARASSILTSRGGPIRAVQRFCASPREGFRHFARSCLSRAEPGLARACRSRFSRFCFGFGSVGFAVTP